MTNNTPKNDQAQKDWDDLQRDLDTLGEQLKTLREHAGTLGETILANIDLRFQDVVSRTQGYRNTTQRQLEEMRDTAMTQAAQTQSSLTETGMKSAEMAKDTARQMWERSEPFRIGAQEVGQGLVRAWSEIAASFGKAAEKVQSERAKSATGAESQKPS